jgi:hypothetical protein
MTSWWLTDSDSAATAPRPPQVPSFATVTKQMGDQDVSRMKSER